MSLISPDQTITIALSVKDRHASAAWYADILGFETIYQFAEIEEISLEFAEAGCEERE